jgi:hypothetical protein
MNHTNSMMRSLYSFLATGGNTVQAVGVGAGSARASKRFSARQTIEVASDTQCDLGAMLGQR